MKKNVLILPILIISILASCNGTITRLSADGDSDDEQTPYNEETNKKKKTFLARTRARIFGNGKPKAWKQAYASLKAQGYDATFATSYADHYEQQLQLGKSND